MKDDRFKSIAFGVGIAGGAALSVYLLAVRPRHMRWGATDAEVKRSMPGDDLVEHPIHVTTRAVTIRAERTDVWPWLVQMGYGRAGWYTWYRYDNGGVPSADRVVPELQDLKVGDYLPDGPRAVDGFGRWWVRALDAPRSLVLYTRRNPYDGREVPEGETGPYLDCSWAFVLEPDASGGTHVLVRVRARFRNVRGGALLARTMRLFFGVGDTVMERSLLDGLKARAERAAAQS